MTATAIEKGKMVFEAMCNGIKREDIYDLYNAWWDKTDHFLKLYLQSNEYKIKYTYEISALTANSYIVADLANGEHKIQIPIDFSYFTIRAVKYLLNNHILFVEDLRQHLHCAGKRFDYKRDAEILRTTKNFGRKTLNELKSYLSLVHLPDGESSRPGF
jgi:hypothetical protein